MSTVLQAFQFDGTISPEHQSYLKEKGVLHFKHFVCRNTIDNLLREIKMVEHYLIKTGRKKVNGVPLKYGMDVNGKTIIQRLVFASRYSSVLSNFLETDKIQSLKTLLPYHDARIVENEKDGLVVSHYVNFGGSAYTKMGWHTDSPRDLFLGRPIRPMMNIGLHLDDCPFENGGLRVLAGTHNNGMASLLFKKKYFIDHQSDKNETGFSIEAGDLTIHDGRLWHRVEKSPFTGEKSRRRVMYIPIITGPCQERNEQSATPLYHYFARLNPRALFTGMKQKSTPPYPDASLMPDLK